MLKNTFLRVMLYTYAQFAWPGKFNADNLADLTDLAFNKISILSLAVRVDRLTKFVIKKPYYL